MSLRGESFQFAIAWKGSNGTIICNCIGEVASTMKAPCAAKIVDVVSCRIESTNGMTALIEDRKTLPPHVREEVNALIGKVIHVAEDVLEHGLVQYIDPPHGK